MPISINLKAEYNIKLSHHEKLRVELVTQLSHLLSNSKIKLAGPIESRVKDWESIAEKLNRNTVTRATLGDLNDITGLRIICLFLRDIAEVRRIVNNNFVVLREEDTSSRLSDNQFGYGSIHFEIELPAAWTTVPTFENLRGLKAEIQVRTVAQHAWAGASHVLQYKHEKDVPVPLKRSINRIAALLETVDLEFNRLAEMRDSYILQFNEDNNLNEENPKIIDDNLNVDVLKQILDILLPPQNKYENEQYSILLEDLRSFQINEIGHLIDFIVKNLEAVIEDDKKTVAILQKNISNGTFDGSEQDKLRLDSGVWWTHSGMIRRALIFENGDKANHYYDNAG